MAYSSNKKAVLITGGAGFIGSHLAEKLLARGKKVFVIDNLSTGRIENIKHLLGDKNFTFKEGTIFNQSLIRRYVAKSDDIYHLAAAVGVKTVMEKPLESLLLNTRGTEIVLEAAEKHTVPVLIASTSEIYGKNTKVPFSERDDRVYGPVHNYRWGYAFSKGVDEFLGLAYFRERGVPVRVVRFFNTIGPRQAGEYGMVVPRFVQAALSGKPITIHGTGGQTRCFGDVDDVTDAITKLMATAKSAGEVYNIGSDQEITIEQLAKKIITLTGSASHIKKISYERAYGEGFEDMYRRKPDLSKIRRHIGYKPKHDLDHTIKRIIAYEMNR